MNDIINMIIGSARRFLIFEISSSILIGNLIFVVGIYAIKYLHKIKTKLIG